MNVGTARALPGERTTGFLEATDLPTGGSERIPVIIARGERDGPTLWITGGIHGNELTGIAATQDVLADGIPDGLRGTVVCLPMCNPAGIRRVTRHSYYHDDDPNRYFPAADLEQTTEKRVQERINERLYDELVDSADALLDLHTAQIHSVPFVIRDRVLYGEHRTAKEACELAERLTSFARATEIPTVTEYPADEYMERNLHRSTAGAILNDAGIPALTLELGSYDVVEKSGRAAGVAAVYRAMVHFDMLDAVPDRVSESAPTLEPPVDFPVRRFVGPQTSRAGLCRHRLQPGDAFEAGDIVADVVNPHGESLESVEVAHDGYVLGHCSPVVYESDSLSSLAVQDDGELVAQRGETKREHE